MPNPRRVHQHSRQLRQTPPRRVAVTPIVVVFAFAFFWIIPLLAEDRIAAKNSPRQWPSYQGGIRPTSMSRDFPRVDRAEDVRLLWDGPRHMGIGKSSTGGVKKQVFAYAAEQGLADFHDGGTTTPIVADGQVFVSYFRPSGLVEYRNFSERQPTRPRAFRKVAADDVLVAINATTGKQTWQAVEDQAGLNRGGGKRVFWSVTPAYADGRVFTLGTLGHLRAYNADTGEKLWETEPDPTLVALKKDVMSTRMQSGSLLGQGGAVGPPRKSGLVVADNVLIVTGRDGVLHGRDVASGNILWQHQTKPRQSYCSRWATPAVWEHSGKQWIVVCSQDRDGEKTFGTLRAIDPRTGQVKWAHTVGTNLGSLLIRGDHVVLGVRDLPADEKFAVRSGAKPKAKHTIIGAVQLSTKGAEVLWELQPADPKFWWQHPLDGGPIRRVTLDSQRVYIGFHRDKSTQRPGRWAVVDLQSGQLIADADVNPRDGDDFKLPMLCGDRLVTIHDTVHGNSLRMHLYALSDQRGLVSLGRISKQHFALTGYESPMECPLVDGRLYLRSMKGVACYSLRK